MNPSGRFPVVVGDPTYPVSLDALPAPPRPKAKEPKPPAPQQPTLDAGLPAPKRRRVNTSSKGTAIELAAIKVLEAEGYKVHRCVRTGVKRGPLYISQSNDVFGCIDLVAKRRGERTRWIQVTADSGVGRKKKDIGEVPWDPVFDAVEIWRWVGGAARRHKTTGAFLERQYFQVYRLDHGFELRKDDRVLLNPPAPTPGGTAT
jgi:hypothetical protein